MEEASKMNCQECGHIWTGDIYVEKVTWEKAREPGIVDLEDGENYLDGKSQQWKGAPKSQRKARAAGDNMEEIQVPGTG